MDKMLHESVAAYLNTLEPSVKEKLLQIRACVFEMIPDAEEGISYQMPAYKYKGLVLCMAAFKNHIGLYPTAAPIAHFSELLQPYKTSKGAIQLPLTEPLPLDIIKKIIAYKVALNLKKGYSENKS